jgi:hypothetical protein
VKDGGFRVAWYRTSIAEPVERGPFPSVYEVKRLSARLVECEEDGRVWRGWSSVKRMVECEEGRRV